MNLKRYAYDKNPFETFVSEFDLSEKTFGMRGHSPLSLKISTTMFKAIEILHRGKLLASLHFSVDYAGEAPDHVCAYDVKVPNLTAQAETKLLAAAQALITKIDDALEMRAARLARIENDIYEATGPRDASKVIVPISSAETLRGFRDLLFPGIAPRALPDQFEIGDDACQSGRYTFRIVHVEPVGQTHIKTDVARIRYASGGVLDAIGPGQRKPARLAFTQEVLASATRVRTEITDDPALRQAMTQQIENNAGLMIRLRENVRPDVMNRTRGRGFEAYHHVSKAYDHMNEGRRSVKNTLALPDSPFIVEETHHGIEDFNILYNGTIIHDSDLGFIPGFPEELQDDFRLSVMISMINAHGEFMHDDYVRKMLKAGMDADIDTTADLDITADTEPRVDLYI